jgi:hypothetical protein
MPRYWSYGIGTNVQINANAWVDLPNLVGLQGVIVEQLNSVRFDYELYLETGDLVRVQESEITIARGDADEEMESF